MFSVLVCDPASGYQWSAPSLGHEGMVTGPMTGDGVLLAPQDDAEGAKTLALAKDHVWGDEHPSLRAILGCGDR